MISPEDEIRNGNNAERAYNTFFKQYFDTNMEALYKEFISGTITEDNRQLHLALTRIDNDIQQIIQSGKFAQQQIKDN